MKINIKAIEAKLTHVNLNTEGSEESQVSRTDLDFECLCEASIVGMLFGTDNINAFWDNDGNIRLLGIKHIPSRAELRNATLVFGEDGDELKVTECAAKNFKAKPINGRQVMVTLQVQVHHTPDQLTHIDRLQKKTFPLHIFTSQDDLFD